MKLFTIFSCLILSMNSLLCPNLDLPRKEIVYQNTGKLIPDLWQGRIMTPGYNSQIAINYMAFVFLQEILGMNVTFYPYNEPQFIANYEINGQNNPYPKYYYEFISNDDIDLTFESWTSQEVDSDALNQYFLPGKVDYQVNGIFGEVGWFVPKYFADKYPRAILIHFLQNDDEIRNLLIAGSNGSYPNTTNWIEYYSDQNNLPTPYRWDLANRTINNTQPPVAWGSVEDYFMSEWSFDVSRNNDLSFVSIGSESKINSMIIELYNAKAPFIVNIYIPDDNFATLDNDGNVLIFEKVILPFNAAQTFGSDCFIERRCQFPLEALKKLKNPRLYDRFPEMADFYKIFSVNPVLLSYMITNYIEIRNEDISEHQKWIKATCDWLNDSRVTESWNNNIWLIDVKRWDCVPGCGILSNNKYIGGTCDHFNVNAIGDGTCICNHKELFGDKCDKSCPGLNIENDEILFCNNNGVCNTDSFTCVCNYGYGGEGCQEKFTIFKISKLLQIFIISISGVLILIVLLCIYWLITNKEYVKVKILRIKLTFLFSIGLILILLSNIIRVLDITNFYCISWFWIFNYGCILLITPSLLKTYRIYKIYNDGFIRNDLNITDNKLILYIGIFLLIDTVLCSFYTYYQLQNSITKITNIEKLELLYTCNNSSVIDFITLISYICYTILILLNTYLSYNLRRIKNYNETLCIFFSSIFSLFCGFILIAFYRSSDNNLFRVIIYSCTVFIIVIQILLTYFGVKIYDFYKYPEKRNITIDIDIEISISERDIELR